MTAAELFLSGYPASTADLYRRILHALATYTGSAPELASREQVASFVAAQTAAPSTVRTRISALAAFYSWLVDTGQREDNPTRGLRRPRVDRMAAVQPISADAMLRLVEAAPTPRDRALLWLLLHGLRLAEVTGLNVEDVNGDELRVIGKGGKVRTVVVEPAAFSALRDYIGGRRSGPLFLAAKRRLSRRQIARIVARLGDETGTSGLHPHRLRHSYLTSLAASGTNAFMLAEIAGHADTSTTSRYVKLTGLAVREHVRSHPLAGRAERQRTTVIEGSAAAGARSLPAKDNAHSGRRESTATPERAQP